MLTTEKFHVNKNVQHNINNTELDIFALGVCGIALGYFSTEKNISKIWRGDKKIK